MAQLANLRIERKFQAFGLSVPKAANPRMPARPGGQHEREARARVAGERPTSARFPRFCGLLPSQPNRSHEMSEFIICDAQPLQDCKQLQGRENLNVIR